MNKLRFIITITIAATTSPYAHSSPPIHSLSSCTSSFFKNLSDNKDTSTIISNFYKTGVSEGKYKHLINLSDNGIKLNSFNFSYTNFDKYKSSSLGAPTGKYYYWGFESNQPIAEVAKLISDKIDIVKTSNDTYIYNPEYRNSLEEAWKLNYSPVGGVAPDKDSAEKLFIIESNDNGGTTIYCSLQGNVNDADLRHAGLLK